MSIRIPFTGNYSDLSNNDGYQFEFRCERCGNGFRSGFQRDMAATGQKFVQGLGRLVGYGAMYRVTSAADRFLDRSTNSEAKDKALAEAVAGITAFPPVPWLRRLGVRRGLLERSRRPVRALLPNQAHELAQLQADARRDQMREGLRNVNLIGGVDLGQQSSTRCPSCGTPHRAAGSVRRAARRSPSRRPAGAARTATRSARSIVSSAGNRSPEHLHLLDVLLVDDDDAAGGELDTQLAGRKVTEELTGLTGGEHAAAHSCRTHESSYPRA